MRLVWTNRANVLAMCAAGVIWPSKLYRKHYPDISDVTEGRIPVFNERIPSQLRTAFDADTELFDVALEVDSAAVQDAQVIESGAWSVSLAGQPIPWAAVKTLHVRSSVDAEDLQARDFADLPAAALTIQVSPQIWEAEATNPGVAEQMAAVAPGSAGSIPMIAADRFAGGIALMHRVLPRTLACELGVAYLLSRNVRARQLPKSMPAVPPWLVRLRNLEPSGEPTGDIDQHLFRAVLVVIDHRRVENGGDSRDIADAIAEEAVRTGGSSIEAEVRQWAAFARRLADGEAPVHALDESGSEVRRALLLFLLRTEPARMLKAAQSNLRPSPAVHSLAAFLSGFASGYSRLERDTKGDLNTHRAMSLVILNRVRQLSASKEDDEELQVYLSPCEDEPPGTAVIRTTISGLLLWDRRTEPADDMKKLYLQAKAAGIELTFDPVWSRFTARVDVGDDKPHTVFVEQGMRSRHNQPSVRFSSDCSLPAGRSARTLSKTELLALLERNADLDMQCRFGVSRTDGTLQVVAHQLVETLDVPELKAHLDAVARTASEVTVRVAATAQQEPKTVG